MTYTAARGISLTETLRGALSDLITSVSAAMAAPAAPKARQTHGTPSSKPMAHSAFMGTDMNGNPVWSTRA